MRDSYFGLTDKAKKLFFNYYWKRWDLDHECYIPGKTESWYFLVECDDRAYTYFYDVPDKKLEELTTLLDECGIEYKVKKFWKDMEYSNVTTQTRFDEFIKVLKLTYGSLE